MEAGSAPTVAHPPRPHLHALTGLRFLAAFVVVLFHCTTWMDEGPWWTRNVVGAGYAAVSLFFVLSGFILAYTYCGERAKAGRATSIAVAPGDRGGGTATIPPREFYVSRVARIYPVYALGLLITLPFFVVHALRHHQVPRMVLDGALVVGMVQAHFGPHAMAWNPPAWSVSAEAFFYALFPFIGVRFLRMTATRAWVTAGLAWLAAMGLGALYMAVRPDGPVALEHRTMAFWLDLYKYAPVVRLPEFLVGIVTGLAFLRMERRPVDAPARVRPEWLVGAAGGVVMVALMFSDRLPYVLLHNGLLAPVYAVLILGLAHDRGWVARALGSAPLRLLGEASYSLYILHLPLLIVAKTTWKGPWHAGVFLLITVLASIASYRWVEMPLRSRIRDALVGRPNPSRSAATATLRRA